MYVITFANPKGGSGKTTSAMLLAEQIAISGGRVSILDLDPNANILAWGHCIKVTLLSGSRERTENLCGIAKIILPQWPEAIRAERRVHVPQVIPGQSDMGPAKRRDVFDDFV